MELGYINTVSPKRRIVSNVDPERDEFIRQLEDAHRGRLEAAHCDVGEEANAIGNESGLNDQDSDENMEVSESKLTGFPGQDAHSS